MALPIIPDQGATQFMQTILDAIRAGGNSAMVRLFQNNITPTSSTVRGDFVEATAGGFGGQATPTAVDAGVVPGGADNWIFSPITWTATGSSLPQTMYGYWVEWVSPLDSTLRLGWCQRFDTPQVITASGQPISFVLSLAGVQC